MPFTPFHFGPHAVIGLPFGKRLDLPVFILANVFIDLEPLAVMGLGLSYPVHGIMHSFLLSLLLLIPLSAACFPLRNLFVELMGLLRLPYESSLAKMVFSGILGGWLHILTDAPLYSDIQPFYPSVSNPLFGLVKVDPMYLLCSWALLPAICIYLAIRFRQSRQTD